MILTNTSTTRAAFQFLPLPGVMFGDANDRVYRPAPRWASVSPQQVGRALVTAQGLLGLWNLMLRRVPVATVCCSAHACWAGHQMCRGLSKADVCMRPGLLGGTACADEVGLRQLGSACVWELFCVFAGCARARRGCRGDCHLLHRGWA